VIQILSLRPFFHPARLFSQVVHQIQSLAKIMFRAQKETEKIASRNPRKFYCLQQPIVDSAFGSFPFGNFLSWHCRC
jgi:hypothetical protein